MMTDKSARIVYLALAAGAAVLFIGGGARFAISLALKPINAEFATGRSLIGGAVLAFQIVSAIALLFAGRLADRFDLRVVLGGGIVVAAAGLTGLAVVETPNQLVLFYGVVFACGTGIASLIPVGVLVTRAFPNHVGTANAVVLTGMGLGQLVIMATFSVLLADIGWRTIFLILGLMHIVLLPLIAFGINAATARAPDRSAQANPFDGATPAGGPALGVIFRSGHFWLLLAVYAICGLQDFYVSTHIVAFAQDQGAPAVFAGNLLALMGLMMLLGVLAAGWVSDRTGPVVPTLACFVLRIGLFAAVLIDASIATVAAFALLFGLTFLVTAPLCIVFARNAFGTRHLGLITGLITMVHHIAGGFGAWLGAAWFDATGNYDAVFVAMLVTSIAGTVLTLMLRPPRP